MIRGIERRKILRDAKDRENFPLRLGNLLLETKTACYAWALLLCSWAVRELGVSLTDLARRLGMSPAGVGYAVQRGEVMARERGCQLYPPLAGYPMSYLLLKGVSHSPTISPASFTRIPCPAATGQSGRKSWPWGPVGQRLCRVFP